MNSQVQGERVAQAARFQRGTFRPAPGRGALGRMLLAHARTEARLTLRNGEQVLLTLLIPAALLVGLSLLRVLPMPEPRVASVTARIFALAVMSSAFTGQAIALGFDRRYGVLKRLAATALPRWLLVAGRLVAAVLVVVVQLVVLGAIALALGWQPTLVGLAWTVPLVLLGTLAFGALGVLVGGALKAELVLALANVLWFVLLMVGGIALAPGTLPGWATDLVAWLPSGALVNGLQAALAEAAAPGWQPVVALLAWTAVGALVASRTTRLT
ncbi:ABC transporter permease [Goodfellowiella coeruleoviolacea]|uniref:ABC-2 type transport system permease protein n=1 Tax=Goodfellowiella coeruleoviolacea TaxID=334858 RepID=A0AAE3KKK8_9PSEU|nr:ABC transporter permease [Goodfellowiella coeruleoviolacea]MCP2170257.1 ABC-2 type transport system permease protein [Goodfellowiella coeruleoviolacea]